MSRYRVSEPVANRDVLGYIQQWMVLDANGRGYHISWRQYNPGYPGHRRECMAFEYGNGDVLSWRYVAVVYGMSADKSLKAIIKQLGIEVEK